MIIFSEQLDKRKRKIQRLTAQKPPSFFEKFGSIPSKFGGDYNCTKDGLDYVFDIKFKYSNESIKRKRFDFTGNEIDHYKKIQKEKNVKVMIMVIFEIENKILYKIFNWNEFQYPVSYTHDSSRVRASLKNLDFDQFSTLHCIIFHQVPFNELKNADDIIRTH